MAYKKKLSKLFYLYDEYIYPRAAHIRGTTRLRSFLEKLVFSTYSNERENGYEFIEDKLHLRFREKEFIYPYFHEKEFLEVLTRNQYNQIIDIGSFRGFYSIFAKKANPDSKVYCFEMSEVNAQKIKDNLKLNNLENDVNLVEKGIWSNKKTQKARIDDDGRSKIGRGSEEVQLISLDSYLKSTDLEPDLVKIDVEGAELKVLEGSKDTLETYQPDILLELHKNERIENFNHNPEEVLDFLETLGYSCLKLKSGSFDDLYYCRN